jgi:hypothetical protein
VLGLQTCTTRPSKFLIFFQYRHAP